MSKLEVCIASLACLNSVRDSKLHQAATILLKPDLHGFDRNLLSYKGGDRGLLHSIQIPPWQAKILEASLIDKQNHLWSDARSIQVAGGKYRVTNFAHITRREKKWLPMVSKNGNPSCSRDVRVEPGCTTKQKVTKLEQVFVLYWAGRLCSYSCRTVAWDWKFVGNSRTGNRLFWVRGMYGYVWVCTGIWESGSGNGDRVLMGSEVNIQYIDCLVLIHAICERSVLYCGPIGRTDSVRALGDECLLIICLLHR